MSEFPTNMKVHPKVESFFDPQTYTISHIVMDPGSTSCAVIDSVMDINYAAGRISYEHADEIIAYIQKHNLKLDWLIETHVHADASVCGPLYPVQTRWKNRDRGSDHRCARNIWQGVQ